MQKNQLLSLKKLKNTGSAQLCISEQCYEMINYIPYPTIILY